MTADQKRQIANLRRRRTIGFVGQDGPEHSQTLREFMEDYAPDGLDYAKELVVRGVFTPPSVVGEHYVRDYIALNAQIIREDPSWADRVLKDYDEALAWLDSIR